MAVRLQMKLGVVAQQDRLPDSPDTVVVVEPSAGSVARAKGHLYLLVTSQVPGHRAHEATRLAAETIRNEYYYEESSGIRACLENAIGLANKRLSHQLERLSLGRPGDPAGPIGVGVAVVRGKELYVATVGPGDAYLVRHARISTLPDRGRSRGLPARDLRIDVWRGEIAAGDSLVLISPNVVARLGLEELKDALVTLHPQSAMEHLHHRFVAAEGGGSDGAIAFEATELVGPPRARRFSPPAADDAGADAAAAAIPLADPGIGGVAAMQSGARRSREAAGTAFQRAVVRFQDLVPQRRTPHRRVRPASRRRETRLRAGVAALAFVVVAFGLGAAVSLAPRDLRPRETATPVSRGERAIDTVRANLARVFGPDDTLAEDDPEEARELLNEAYEELDAAEAAGVSGARIRPLRAEVVDGIDRLYSMITVSDRIVYAFDPDANPKIDLAALIRGPDGAPYVLDRTTKGVWRINTASQLATPVIREGFEDGDVVAGTPRLLATGGSDLIVLDSNSVLWRWRPTDAEGGGTLSRIRVSGADGWGDDVVALGTFRASVGDGLYNLYVVDPSEDQIRSYSPAADGGGFPSGTSWLNTDRPVDGVTSLYIDGDIWLADDGDVVRFASGQIDGYEPQPPGDEIIRDAPEYRVIASSTPRRQGRVYLYDEANERVLAVDKGEATFLEQYRLASGNDAFSDVRDMYAVPSGDGSGDTLVWITSEQIHAARLEPVGDVPPSPDPSSPSSSPGASVAASPEP